MKVLVAMNSFKGSLSALEACSIVSNGIRDVRPDITIFESPLTDGGTGSLAVWSKLLDIAPVTLATVDPLGRSIKAPVLINGECVYIEMAQASGLHLLRPNELDVLGCSTYGTGLLIRQALKLGCRRIFVGLGGSATHDLGSGILRALGASFLDSDGRCLETPQELLRLDSIDDSGIVPAAQEAEFVLLCDVTNPLLGTHGAAMTYAPQKGANSKAKVALCESISQAVVRCLRRRGIEVGCQPGDGAAGGIPTLMRGLLTASVESGSEFTARLSGLDESIMQADLIVTGEGSFDHQSYYGKGPGFVIGKATMADKPVAVLTGQSFMTPEAKSKVSVFTINQRLTTAAEAFDNAALWLRLTASQVAKLFFLGYNAARR